MYNTSINNLEKEIIEAINKSRLHIGTISLVLNKVSNMVKSSLNEELLREEQELLAEQQSKLSNINDMIEIDESLIDKNN